MTALLFCKPGFMRLILQDRLLVRAIVRRRIIFKGEAFRATAERYPVLSVGAPPEKTVIAIGGAT